MEYTPNEIERKWRSYWQENEFYKVETDHSKPKYYILDMFPYPSGEGLHVGHPLGFIATDIYARYKRLQGYNVLHPMGFDSFGLPAEQYAIDTGVSPILSTAKNEAYYRSQLENLGFSYDWSRTLSTCSPDYYAWTQYLFLELFNSYYDNHIEKAAPIANLIAHFEKYGSEGIQAANDYTGHFSATDWTNFSAKEKDEVLMSFRLGFRKVTYVNWCEGLGCVLANDEVVNGVSERGGFPVEKRMMMQWSLRITAYAERLLNDLDSLDWSDSLKAIQRNWIGRSEGAQLFFAIADSSKKLEIYTTRPDTIFGVTFMVIAPEHPLLDELTTAAQRPEIDKYLEYAKARSERERQSDVKHVTGAFTGSYCIHPFTGEQIPIWTSEYVLAGYGTGAIMAVPADDERDQRFAQHFHLPIIDIIDKSAYPHATIEDKLGKMIQSDFLNGMEVLDAIRKVNEIMEERKIGKRRINFKMRDVIFSRQRYWGEPMPIKYDKDGVAHPETNLPLELPAMDDFKPTGSIKGPLSKATDWVNTPDGMQRETDTMPGFAGSSWYYLRYMDAQNKQNPFSQEAVNYWKNVDLYLGGQEHATGHLLYARLFHKFLYDKGLVPTIEPFQKLINQGMIQGVIERILRLNEKQNGRYVYICASLASQYKEAYTTVNIHTKLVDDYDVSTPSYLSLAGIREFIKWRPENEGALFLFPNGQYDTASQEWSSNDGTDANQVRFYTQSEIGKMSKRYFNVVNPDDMIARYGTDCFRLYEMFLGPLEQSKPWNTNGIEGVSKFLRKLWSLFYDNLKGAISLENTSPSAKEWKVLHQTIKKVRHDLDRFSFNTCVSHFMIAVNDLKDLKCKNALILQDLIVLISPFAPHIAEELYKNALQNEGSVLFAALPEHNELYLVESEIEYPIQINGKLRGHVAYPADTSVSEIEKTVIEQEVVQRWAEGKTIKKIIVVPTKMINIVIV